MRGSARLTDSVVSAVGTKVTLYAALASTPRDRQRLITKERQTLAMWFAQTQVLEALRGLGKRFGQFDAGEVCTHAGVSPTQGRVQCHLGRAIHVAARMRRGHSSSCRFAEHCARTTAGDRACMGSHPWPMCSCHTSAKTPPSRRRFRVGSERAGFSVWWDRHIRESGPSRVPFGPVAAFRILRRAAIGSSSGSAMIRSTS